MATVNGLFLAPYENEFQLTELENNLIALIINFQYIYCLKMSRWAATKKQMITVPVSQETVQNTLRKMPRLPSEACFIEVGIKRKKEYNRAHRQEIVDIKKTIRAVQHLKKSGHPYYQDFDFDFESYEERCKQLDEAGHTFLFGDSDEEELVEASETKEDHKNDKEIDDETDDTTLDAVRRQQFDHNRNTCMMNNYPEMLTDKNGKSNNETLSFAPAEGNCPTNILEEKDWDIKSWPALLPDGKFGIHFKRKVKLTDQQYFGQRILNHDTRFSRSPSYIFAAANYIEQKQLSSKANISFMRGQKSTSAEGTTQYQLEDAFTTFDGIKNTPKYWQKVKYDMIAKLENLSCGDTRYDENFSSYLVQNNYSVEYITNPDGTTETRINCRGTNKTLEEFLSEDINESLHEMIRTNVLTATRNFHQGRGAAHIHGTIWLDIKEIEKLETFQDGQCGPRILSEAFRKLRDDIKLNETEKGAIVKLTDMFVSCSLNPDTVHENKERGEKIIKIIQEVNSHNCTSPCKKYGDKCMYGFPRYPLKSTIVIDKTDIQPVEAPNAETKERKNYGKILSDVEDVLNDDEKVQEIMSKYPKGSTDEEYKENRAKRIDLLLEKSGGITYEDYIIAIKKSNKQGSTVMLQRDVDETRINNYNPEWAMVWNANHDIQPTLDFFGVITYVTDYWAKPDEGITQYLREAAALLKSEPDQQKRCQQLANTFLTHRQMGEAEAYYKIFPHLTLKYSSVDTIFVPSDKKELRSKFLRKLDKDDANFDKGTEVAG